MPITSVFNPVSPQGQDIANLFKLALSIGAVVFLLVAFLQTRKSPRPNVAGGPVAH